MGSNYHRAVTLANRHLAPPAVGRTARRRRHLPPLSRTGQRSQSLWGRVGRRWRRRRGRARWDDRPDSGAPELRLLRCPPSDEIAGGDSPARCSHPRAPARDFRVTDRHPWGQCPPRPLWYTGRSRIHSDPVLPTADPAARWLGALRHCDV